MPCETSCGALIDTSYYSYSALAALPAADATGSRPGELSLPLCRSFATYAPEEDTFGPMM